MKYKRLSTEELQVMEQDFIHFLASAQITGQDWEKMKMKDAEQANELMDVFSDVVYDKILRKIKFLEYRDAKTMNIFHCDLNKMYLVGIRVNENSSLDLTASDVLSQWNENSNSSVNVLKSEKKYTKERELEVFEMLQNGCLITDSKLFDLLMK